MKNHFCKHNLSFFLIFFVLTMLLAACAPEMQPTEAESPVSAEEPVALTEETSPTAIDPVPTEAPVTPTAEATAPAVPESCQVEGMQTYINDLDGYCFAYPTKFTLGDEYRRFPGLYGPKLDPTSIEPVQVSMGIQVQALNAGMDLSRLVDAYLSQSMFQGIPWEIGRTQISLGGETAEVLEDIPGRGSSRHVMSIHENRLVTLYFYPSDFPEVDADLTALFDAVTASFTYMEPTAEPLTPAWPQDSVWAEFEQRFTLPFDPSLALWVDMGTVPAVPVDPSVMFAESQPSHVLFRLLGYQLGQFQLPYPLTEPRVMIYPVSEFAGYGDDQPTGFLAQQQALADLLAKGLDPKACEQARFMGSADLPPFFLPFLPWLNSAQMFCAQPAEQAFVGGKGIRYLTYYTQGPGPILEGQVFYTFQGLTGDGEFYVSAFFPVETGIFPAVPPQDFPNCVDPAEAEQCKSQGSDQLARLNGLDAAAFSPALDALDALIGSLRIEKP